MDQKFWKGFFNPPAEYNQAPFWFLNDVVDGGEYCRQIDEMAEKGVRAAMPHPRFGMDRRDYLTEKYFDAFGQLLDHAREKEFTIHLYDEYNWSSGNAGARLTKDPAQCALAVCAQVRWVQGPETVRFSDWEKGLKGWAVKEDILLVGCAPALGSGRIDEERQTLLEAKWQDGDMVVQTPAGELCVYVLYTVRTRHPSPLRQGNGGIADYLNPDVTRQFIELTHEQYYRHFSEHFGTTIPSIFYDEVGPYAGGNFTWTRDFDERFLKRKGYSLIPLLPLLFLDGSKQTPKVRCDYWDVLSQTFCESFLNPIRDWCQQHGIAFTGHAHEDASLWMINGNLFRALRRQHWVGLDSLGGYKKYSALKSAVSAAHISGSKVVLCEALGLLGGWDCSPRMLKKAYNQLAVAGVNLLVPHAFFQSVDNPKVECPPSFFENNPYWRYYRDIARLTDLQCYVNRQGHHVADAAVFYPVVSWWANSRDGRGRTFPWSMDWEHAREQGRMAWANEAQAFDRAVDEMVSQHIDLDILDDQALNEARVCSGRLCLRDETYRCLVLPPMTTLRRADVKRFLELAQEGLALFIMAGFEPLASMEQGKDDEQLIEDVRRLMERAVLVADETELTQRIRASVDCDVTVLRGSGADLDVSHRQVGDLDIYLLSNTSSESRRFELKLRSSGRYGALLDGYGRRMECRLETGEECWAQIELPEEELCYLILSAEPLPNEIPLAPPAISGEEQDFSEGFRFLPLPGGAEQMEEQTVELAVPVLRTRQLSYESQDSEALAAIWKNWMQPDYDDSEWTQAALKRGSLTYDHVGSRLFRFVIPAGARALKMPLGINCEYALYINGELVRVQEGHEQLEPFELPIAGCEQTPGVLAVELSAMAPDFGFIRPPVFRMEKRPAMLTSWKDWGLSWYSGFGLYEKHFDLLGWTGERVVLELGEVRECAEIYLNGVRLGASIWPPYRVELTPFLKQTNNQLKVEVCNLISNEYAWDHRGSRGDGHELDSGLLGKARLILEK